MRPRRASRLVTPGRGVPRDGAPAVAAVLCAALCALATPGSAEPAAAPERPGAPASLHRWGAVTLFHGLPSDHVRAVAQDAEGALWFGTDAGLARYDGRRTQTVASGRVLALAVAPDGVLWAGTEDGARRVREGASERVGGTEGLSVTAVAFDAEGRAVLATSDGHVLAVSPDGAVSRVAGPETSPLLRTASGPLAITSVAAARAPAGEAPGAAPGTTSAATLLVGTRGRGVLAVDGGGVREIPSRPRAFFVEAIAVDAAGRPWLGAQTTAEDSGLFESGSLVRPRKVGSRTGVVNALRFDPRGDLWAGTDGQGAIRFRDGAEVERITFAGSGGGLRSDRVYAVFVDREGVVWFGTDRGACRYDPGSPLAESLSDDAESSFVRAIARTPDGRVWAGTNRGLFVGAPGAWRAVAGLERQPVYALAVAGGEVYAGCGRGLYSIAAGAERAERVDPPGQGGEPAGVRSLAVFRGAVHVARFGGGVERLERGGAASVWSAPGVEALALHAEGDARLWVGTSAGAVAIGDGGAARVEGLDGRAVWAVDGRGEEVWFAAGDGLFALRGGALERVLEGVEARCVVADGAPGAAWVGAADGGLHRVATAAGETLVSRFDTEHGLPSGAVFALEGEKAAGGRVSRLWIGTSRGLARYEPGGVAPLLRPTRVLGDRAYEPGEVAGLLSLPYPQNSLVVEVAAASSRTFPEQFLYRFDVFDEGGRAVASALAAETQFVAEGLAPGRYRAVARAFSKDLVASEPLEVRFEVAPAPFPWGTAALGALLALSLAALWWGARQNRRLAGLNAALAGANRDLAETRLRLANEAESERQRIARDLHDQTLADLRRLLMAADALGPAAPQPAAPQPAAPQPAAHELASGPAVAAAVALDAAALRAEIETISGEIRRICEDLSPSVLANVGLAAALEWALANAVAHLPPERKFDYSFRCDAGQEEGPGLGPAREIQLYRIVQEAINNVCRHARASRVRLSVERRDGGALAVELEDDGRGFDPASSRAGGGRGLGNIRSRAEMIGAEVSWSARPGGGTLFRVRVAEPASRGGAETRS